ncbi:MAG: DHHA1 domain-containing protein, partial [Candidatus Omnitrophica bacterium]|nr:DHHA1 domain-containing protein [Candidatus Omnitrophota bacterium]
LAIAVDCSNQEILGKAFQTFLKAKDILEIDHHEFRRPFGSIRLVNHKAAAVGEIIYALLKELKITVSKDIALNLLTSIVVETNSFRLPNVDPDTFQTCADLIKKRVDFHKLVEIVFWAKNKGAIMLTGLCLTRCKFLKGGKIIWSIIKNSDFKKLKGKDEDVDDVADEMRSITGIKVVVLFREKEKKTLRVSLRSRDSINIAGVAEKYNGGGHFDVAGCSIPNNPQAIKRFLKDVEGVV